MRIENLIKENSPILNETEVDAKVATKQNTLVSGTNIKTINGQDILGEGNIVIEGGSGGGSNASFSKDYTEAEMTDKVATVEHNLNSENVSVTVYDQDGKQVIAEDVVIVDVNSLTVDVSTLTLTGIKVVVLASGGSGGEVKGLISDIKLDPEGNLINPDTVTPGYYVSNTTGQLLVNAAYYTTDFIEITPDVVYNFGWETDPNQLARFVAVYDENKTVIAAQGGANVGILTPTGNARFVRISIHSAATGFLRISPFDTYVPYGTQVADMYLDPSYNWKYNQPTSLVSNEIMKTEVLNQVETVKDELSSVIQEDGEIAQTWKESINYGFFNNNSTFSGWGWVVDGMDKAMAGIQFRIINRDTKPITKVRACIRKGARDAEILWEKTVDVNIDINNEEYVNIFFDEPTYFEDEILFVCYQANALSTRYGGSSGEAVAKYTNDKGYSTATYWSNGSIENTLGSASYGTPSYASYYAFIEKQTNISDEQIDLIAEKLSLPTSEFLNNLVNLPNRIHAVQNDTLQLFYRGMINDANPYEKYSLHFSSAVGRNTNRYWELVRSTTGTHTSRMVVRDSDLNILSQKYVEVVINPTPTNPTTRQHILCVGDSLTSGGTWVTEGQRRLTRTGGAPEGLGLDETLIRTIGRKSNNIANWEGTGGWTWASYANAGSRAYRFNVTNITEAVLLDSLYTVGDLVLSVREVNVTDSTGEIMMSFSSGTGEPPANGTLTLSSSNTGVQTSITYTSFEDEVSNPFWNNDTNTIDFTSYVNQYGDGQLDVVYTLLTWNGQTADRTDFSSMEVDMIKFMTALKEQYPNVKLKLMGVQLPSLNGGLGFNYGATLDSYADQDGLCRTVFNMNNFYQEFANRPEYADWIEFINVSAQFDSEYNMQYREDPVNTRSTVTEMIGTNGVHPSENGYLQIGDIFYRSLANYLSEL